MTKEELFKQIQAKENYLCIGLDTDIKKIPSFLHKEKDPVFEFNKRIIDATSDLCVAYKPNIAFYEALGVKGWESLAKTLDYIPKDIFTIADAKRGDIGNTSSLYARAFFDKASSGLEFDSVTVAPYMGSDSVLPFLEFEGKWVILLAVTSNEGGKDFQMMEVGKTGLPLYKEVLKKALSWGDSGNMMFVAGATRADYFKDLREIAPDHFFLVPGIGAQGGDLAQVSQAGMNSQCGLLVNSSRSILYASSGEDFARAAQRAATETAEEMKKYLNLYL